MTPPAPSAKKGITPGGATVLSALAVVLGTVVLFGGVFDHGCDCDNVGDRSDVIIGSSLVVFGPTLVRLKAREVGGVHLGIRLAGAAIIAGATASGTYEDTPYLVGAALLFGGAISDVATVHGAYRRWSERHAMTLVPATVSPSGALAPGLSLGGRF